MENDASSAGVLLGGLFSTVDIKILICYILDAIDEPVPITELANLLHYEGIANGFEVCDAMENLLKGGYVNQADSGKNTYIIAPGGRVIAKELNSSLSKTVKRRAYVATLKMLTLYKNARDTRFEVTHEGNKTYLSCSALDDGVPFITVKMLITDDAQAQFIEEKFLENTSEIFSKLIEMLTK